jgi:hypothetical protein
MKVELDLALDAQQRGPIQERCGAEVPEFHLCGPGLPMDLFY